MLTGLTVLAAFAACWIAVAVDQAARGAVGSLVGVPWSGLALTPYYTMGALQGPTGAPGAFGWALMVLTGPAVLAALALAVHFGLELFRTPGWLRALALEWAVLAVLWTPTVLLTGALPGGGGPVAELYQQLGEPQAGRWAAAGLGLLSLWLLGRFVAARAIAVGRSWMRTDGIEFRRRLVRVVAGYPSVMALGAQLLVAGWAAPAWAGAWLVLVLAVLVRRTP